MPEAEKQTCLIWGKHYSKAGGVNLYRTDYELPKAFSYHGSFYLWTPESGAIPKIVIAFTNGEADINFFRDFFGSVVAVKKIHNPYASFLSRFISDNFYLQRTKTGLCRFTNSI